MTVKRSHVVQKRFFFKLKFFCISFNFIVFVCVCVCVCVCFLFFSSSFILRETVPVMEGQRERGRKRESHVGSTEPDVGLELPNHKIMT